MAGDAASEVSYGEARRRGLTTAERACMKRYAYVSPSPICELKMASWTGPDGFHRRRRKQQAAQDGAARGADGPGGGPLDAVERKYGQILERLLPVPARRPMAAAGPPEDAPPQSGDHPAAAGGGGGGGLASSSSSSAGPGVGAKVRTPVAAKQAPGRAPSFHFDASATATSAAAAAAAAEGPPAPEMRLVKRPVEWDPQANQIRRNVIRLIQGASANKVEREVGGKIKFIHAAGNKDGTASVDEDSDGASASAASPGAKVGGVKNYTRAQGGQEMHGHPLHSFRRRMLQEYSTIIAAFDAINVDRSKSLDMREWCDVVSTWGHCSLFEARVIFELMDADRDGSLTLAEFNIGIEAIAPVTTLAAVRKRLVCLGFGSMLQAIAFMDGGGEDTTFVPLAFPEFAAALRRAWIIEEKEHRAIFDLVCDPNDSSCRASLCDLACGLAAVSPCMVLSEARSQLLNKFGSMDRALDALEDAWLEDRGLFEEKGAEWLGISRGEAAKVFRFTDIDRNGALTRKELMGVLRLSAPSVQLEDIRRKVQQSYRGIEKTLRESFTHEGEELDDELRFSVQELVEVLEPVGMGKVEKENLVRFMEATSDQGITLNEFFRGVRLFAPSVVLEGVRLQLLRTHDRIADAFRHVPNRRTPLNKAEFGELLSSVGVEVRHLDVVFDLLDVRSCGAVTVTELMAALQGSQNGTRRWVGSKEREECVEHQVHEEFAPLKGNLTDLKLGLRRGLRHHPAHHHHREHRDHREHRTATLPAAATVEHGGGGGGGGWGGLGTGGSPQFARRRGKEHNDGEQHLQHSRSLPSALNATSTGMRRASVAVVAKTFQNITASLDALPPEQQAFKQKTVDSVRAYFVSQKQVFVEQEHMLRSKWSKASLHQEMEEKRRLENQLERPKALRCAGQAALTPIPMLPEGSSMLSPQPGLTSSASAPILGATGSSFAGAVSHQQRRPSAGSTGAALPGAASSAGWRTTVSRARPSPPPLEAADVG